MQGECEDGVEFAEVGQRGCDIGGCEDRRK